MYIIKLLKKKILSNRLEDQESKLNKLYSEIEDNLNLIGSTAIEDKLQDNVASTIESFIQIGIKLWVLTGDKANTVISVAKACNLINSKFTIIDLTNTNSSYVNNTNQSSAINSSLLTSNTSFIKQQDTLSYKNLEIILLKALKQVISSKAISKDLFSLCVSTNEFTFILNDSNLKQIFYHLAIQCDSVLCCRIFPKQKAEIVNLVKHFDKSVITLSIGDGANDVSMINSANIGVGIIGIEGRQAERASDYAITEFQHLRNLLFVHGREAYRRNSYVVCYNFYKNIIFVIPQFWYGIVSYFSGQTIYQLWMQQLFNVIFTVIPIFWYGIYDQEFEYYALFRNNSLYKQGVIGKLFHWKRFWRWAFTGIIEGVVIFIISYYCNTNIGLNGKQHDLFSNGSIAYFGIVAIVNIKLLIYSTSHSLLSVGFIVISVLSYFALLGIFSNVPNQEITENFSVLTGSINFYLSMILLCLIINLIDYGVKKFCSIIGIIKDPLTISINSNSYDMNQSCSTSLELIERIKKLDENIKNSII